MDRQRLDQIEELFHAASQLPPGECEAFLADRCSSDRELFQKVRSLLHRRNTGLLDLADRDSWNLEALFPTVAGRSGDGDTASGPALEPGAMVGAYRIEALLGRGGMGEVYRGLDTRLGRSVAVKFLSGAVFASQPALERFRREAQVISRLNHPNVCTVHDIGDAAGQPYLVMELLEGQTLRERITEGPFSDGELLAIMIPVLDALAAAHAAGIVHRDIKPANVFLTRQGLVKILDFGVAKSAGAETGAHRDVAGHLTETGNPIGTISFMSPEQARGGDVDARSDLFSCGVVLYEMATGTLPFAAESWAATRDAVLHRVPRSPRELTPGLLPEIERAIGRALEKDPRQRPQSAEDMRGDLLRARHALESKGNTHGLAGAHLARRLYAVTVMAVLLIFATAVWHWGEGGRRPTSPSEYVRLTNFSDSVAAPALSPDGRMLAFVRGERPFLTTGPIYVKSLPDGQSTQLTDDPRPKYGLVFTPDGRQVAYTAISTDEGAWNVSTVPVTGGTRKRLMQNAAGLTWIGNGAD